MRVRTTDPVTLLVRCRSRGERRSVDFTSSGHRSMALRAWKRLRVGHVMLCSLTTYISFRLALRPAAAAAFEKETDYSWDGLQIRDRIVTPATSRDLPNLNEPADVSMLGK